MTKTARSTDMNIHSKAVVLFTLIIASSFICGCASMPDNRNFKLYAKTVKEMQSATSLAMEKNYNWDRKIFIAEAIKDEKKIDELALGKSGKSSLDYASDAPLYIKIKEDIITFNEINYAMVKYSNALNALSDPDDFSEKQYRQIAENADTLRNSVMNALQKKYGPSNIAIFPLSSHEIISEVKENERIKALKIILSTTQPEIDYFCQISLRIIENIEKKLTVPYDERMRRLKTEYDTISKLPAPAAGDKNAYVETESRKQRKEIILREITLMNESFLYTSFILQEAKTAFAPGGIPQAHSVLLNTLQNPSADTMPLENLFASAGRLKMKIYIESKTGKNYSE